MALPQLPGNVAARPLLQLNPPVLLHQQPVELLLYSPEFWTSRTRR